MTERVVVPFPGALKRREGLNEKFEKALADLDVDFDDRYQRLCGELMKVTAGGRAYSPEAQQVSAEMADAREAHEKERAELLEAVAPTH